MLSKESRAIIRHYYCTCCDDVSSGVAATRSGAGVPSRCLTPRYRFINVSLRLWIIHHLLTRKRGTLYLWVSCPSPFGVFRMMQWAAWMSSRAINFSTGYPLLHHGRRIWICEREEFLRSRFRRKSTISYSTAFHRTDQELHCTLWSEVYGMSSRDSFTMGENLFATTSSMQALSNVVVMSLFPARWRSWSFPGFPCMWWITAVCPSSAHRTLPSFCSASNANMDT